MGSSNLIVVDEYIRSAGEYCKECANVLQTAVDSYIATLEKIRNEAVMEGDFKDAIEAFIQCAKVLEGTISQMGLEMENTCEAFIAEIDEKDSYLY